MSPELKNLYAHRNNTLQLSTIGSETLRYFLLGLTFGHFPFVQQHTRPKYQQIHGNLYYPAAYLWIFAEHYNILRLQNTP